MALILALKNRSAVVAAADIHEAQAHDKFKPLIQLADGSVLLIAGNLAAVEHTVLKTFMPTMKANDDADDAAKLLNETLKAEIMPKLSQLKNPGAFIVSGIDPIG